MPIGKTKKEELRSENKELLLKTSSQYSRMAGVMVSVAVNAVHGFSPVHAVPSNLKTNAVSFVDVLSDQLVPWIIATTGPGSTLILDNAPSHQATKTVQWRKDNLMKHGITLIFQPYGRPL